LKTEQQPKDLKNYAGPDQIISSQEMRLALSKTPDAVIKIKSQIPALDKLIDYFQDGELIAVSGPTKQGKTLFMQSLTVNFSKQGHFPLWFTYEVPARQFLSQFPEMPSFYLPAKLKAHFMPWVEDRIMESFLKYRSRIIIIDHLHYLFDIVGSRSPSLDIGAIIRQLKTLAVTNGFIIFILCHTTKGANEDSLSYESIRDSSFVGQESDSVFMIKRTPAEGEAAARLRVEFHRRTGCLEQIVNLVKVGGLLRERIYEERDDTGRTYKNRE
jgi:hypothetical protein